MALEYDAKPSDLYVTKNGDVWRVVGYQPSPTVILERLVPARESSLGPTQVTHAVGCLNAEEFNRVK